jgi:hypothetical protein
MAKQRHVQAFGVQREEPSVTLITQALLILAKEIQQEADESEPDEAPASRLNEQERNVP